MRKIILESESLYTIPLGEVNQHAPIFAKKDDKLIGMVVKENDGWIVRIGGSAGASGHHETLRKCIESCFCHDYEFFIE